MDQRRCRECGDVLTDKRARWCERHRPRERHKSRFSELEDKLANMEEPPEADLHALIRSAVRADLERIKLRAEAHAMIERGRKLLEQLGDE